MLKRIKSEIDKIIKDKGSKGLSLQDAIILIKKLLEKTIRSNGEKGKTALIRSQQPIKLIHEAVKSSLIKNGVNPRNIFPRLGSSSGELKLSGFLKKKNQDICVKPTGVEGVKETLNVGLLTGQDDLYGKTLTESIISINIRSQLSSLGNNIDTLYERTFAESLNLHMRCNNMCLGEVYLIPVYEYDKHKAQKKKVEFVKTKSKVETYINAFNALNLRNITDGDFYKYERVCLLIVDFNQTPPKIFNTDADLKKDGLIEEDCSSSITQLNFDSFVADLLDVYHKRFPDTKLS